MSTAEIVLTSLFVPKAAARRYVSRGPWLLLSWASAFALFFLTYSTLSSQWPAISAALPGTWLYYMYVSTTFTNVCTQILCNLALLPLYLASGRGGLVDSLKSEADRPWPWMSGDSSERARFWSTVCRSVFLVVPFNMLFVSALGLLSIQPIVDALGIANPTSLEAFPSAFTLAWQVAVCCIVEDTMFYTTHRLLHTPALYRWVHKTHHEYGSVTGPASEHAHPIEFLLGNLLPAIAGPLLLQAHVATLCFFLALRVAVSVEEHSGFSFPLSPLRVTPWAALTAGHAWHHSHTVGVFASQFCILDSVFNTDAGFNAWLEEADMPVASPGVKQSRKKTK